MKVAIINDTHFGARNDSAVFLDHFISFFETQFFPYLKENNIQKVIHLGDFFDRRKFINFNTLNKVRSTIIKGFVDQEIDLHVIVGNHDTYYKNTNKINGLSELVSDRYSNISVYEKPEILELDGLCVGLVPWINAENEEETSQFLKSCKCPIVMGHFELNGYEVMKGVKFDGGRSDKDLKRFEMVLSGHFHSKSSKNNVFYLGTQYQITFGDLNDKKGFHIFDTETRQLEFVSNKDQMFYSIEYDDTDEKTVESLINSIDETFCDKFVKILVQNKSKYHLFDLLLEKLYDVNVSDVSVVEDFSENFEDEEKLDLAQDTLTIINTELENLEDVDLNELKTIMRTLYMESLSDDRSSS
jgi:predicted phosphodiesterase